MVAWLRRWGISFASLAGGLLTLFVFRRGLPRVSWIVGYLLLLWLLVAMLVEVRDTLAASDKRTHRLVLTATEYTVQTLYHGVLLFLLPAYWAATTLSSPNAIFLAVLIILALPLVGVPPFAALLIAAWLAVVALTPAVCRARGWRWRTGVIVTSLVGFVVAAAAGLRPIVIPPAPLFVAQAGLGWTVATIDSLEPIAGAIHAADLRERGLVAYTAIYAPAGLRQAVEHVWRQDGHPLDVVRLTPVEGGRREGFRTFSRKTAFPADPVGRWTVDVMTGHGQLIGRVRFRVVP